MMVELLIDLLRCLAFGDGGVLILSKFFVFFEDVQGRGVFRKDLWWLNDFSILHTDR